MVQVSSYKSPSDRIQGGPPWYDDKESIRLALRHLVGLHRLVSARYAAHYQRKETLGEFYILGRFMLDSCGNCSKAIGVIPKELFPDIPDVLSRDEFNEYVCRHAVGESREFQLAMNGGDIPKPSLKCGHCGRTWDITNCHDTVVHHTTKVISLATFVGRTLADVKEDYGLRSTDAVYRMQDDLILNEKYSNSQKSGWVGKNRGITNQHVVEEGDAVEFNVWMYFHRACNREYIDANQERIFKTMFEAAGFTQIRMQSIPNDYCRCDHCASWFNVYTEIGTIRIGWRKRVINIDWSGMKDMGKPSVSTLFVAEDTTRGDAYIHAWGNEKAQEYLTLIRKHLSA